MILRNFIRTLSSLNKRMFYIVVFGDNLDHKRNRTNLLDLVMCCSSVPKPRCSANGILNTNMITDFIKCQVPGKKKYKALKKCSFCTMKVFGVVKFKSYSYNYLKYTFQKLLYKDKSFKTSIGLKLRIS